MIKSEICGKRDLWFKSILILYINIFYERQAVLVFSPEGQIPSEKIFIIFKNWLHHRSEQLSQLECISIEKTCLARQMSLQISKSIFILMKSDISKKTVDIAFRHTKVSYCNIFLFFSFHFRRTSRIPLYEFGPVEAVTIGSVDLALLLTFAFW